MVICNHRKLPNYVAIFILRQYILRKGYVIKWCVLQKNIRIWSPDIIPYLICTLSKEVLMLLNNKSSAKQIACKFPIVFFGCRWIIFCCCVMLRWMILIDYLLQVKLRLDSQTRFFFFLISKCRLNRALSSQVDAYFYRKHVLG